MEPESPSLYPQVPATCPYPEPNPSSPHDPLQPPEHVYLHVWNSVVKVLAYMTKEASQTDPSLPTDIYRVDEGRKFRVTAIISVVRRHYSHQQYGEKEEELV